MTLLFSPLEQYFDAQGRPTAMGQQLLARINTMIGAVEADVAALTGIPDGGTDGQVLTKLSDADYDADWQTIVISGGSGSFIFDDGTASAGGAFELEDGGA
jgi:hypothetical protein